MSKSIEVTQEKMGEELAEQAELEELNEFEAEFIKEIPEKMKIAHAGLQRFDYLNAYHKMSIQRSIIRASLVANKSMGNTKEAGEWENKLGMIEKDITHILRAVKVIDKSYPKAKAEMERIISAASK